MREGRPSVPLAPLHDKTVRGSRTAVQESAQRQRRGRCRIWGFHISNIEAAHSGMLKERRNADVFLACYVSCLTR